MRKFEGLGLSAVLAVAAVVSGCDRSDDWQASAGPTRVCVDHQGRRVPDSDCAPVATGHGGGVNPFLWYYLGTLQGRRDGAPGVGGVVRGGSYTPEAGVSYRSAPAEGIARGGFGGTAESFGGAHGGGEGGGHGGGAGE